MTRHEPAMNAADMNREFSPRTGYGCDPRRHLGRCARCRAIALFNVVVPCPSGTLIGEDMSGLGEMFVAHNLMFLRRVGPARFERRPTLGNRREIRVGRRGEAPLVPPDSFRSPTKAMALLLGGTRYRLEMKWSIIRRLRGSLATGKCCLRTVASTTVRVWRAGCRKARTGCRRI